MDGEAVLKYLDTQVKELDWRKVMSEAFGVCTKETESHIAEIQKRANFTKEQCNVKFDFITECLDIAAFMVKSFSLYTSSTPVWNFRLTELSKEFMDWKYRVQWRQNIRHRLPQGLRRYGEVYREST